MNDTRISKGQLRRGSLSDSHFPTVHGPQRQCQGASQLCLAVCSQGLRPYVFLFGNPSQTEAPEGRSVAVSLANHLPNQLRLVLSEDLPPSPDPTRAFLFFVSPANSTTWWTPAFPLCRPRTSEAGRALEHILGAVGVTC